MKGYSEREVFEAHELSLLKQATELVANVDDEHFTFVIRCHELARAVGRILRLPHEDGKYTVLPERGGGVDHSWLLVARESRREAPSILDVYAVGQLPQVQLFASALTVPHHRLFMPGRERADIDDRRVVLLMRAMLKCDDVALDDVASKHPKFLSAGAQWRSKVS
jgi:hypothetical protein